MDTVKIGIIGTGWIAEKMAITLEGMEGVEAYAVASRQLQTACDFADRWGFTPQCLGVGLLAVGAGDDEDGVVQHL